MDQLWLLQRRTDFAQDLTIPLCAGPGSSFLAVAGIVLALPLPLQLTAVHNNSPQLHCKHIDVNAWLPAGLTPLACTPF
jgi:hypothetical protein